MSENSTDEIIVNLSAKKTNVGWMRSQDEFFLKATPLFFQWISWTLALGAVAFLNEAKSSLFGVTVLIIGHGLMWGYFIAFFARIHFEGFPFIKSPRADFVLSCLLGLTLLASASYGSQKIADVFTEVQAAKKVQ